MIRAREASVATKKQSPKKKAGAKKKAAPPRRAVASAAKKAPAKKAATKKARPAPKKARSTRGTSAARASSAKTRVATKRRSAATKKAAAKKKPPAPLLAPRESLRLETSVLASPERVYAAWIDSGEHSELTGGEATIDAREGGKHSAWSGYIEGRFVTLEPGKRLVMSWRTTEFDEADPDSLLEVRFSPDGGGTRLELVHTDLPPGGAEKYTTGWREFYFVPMAKYFG